MRMRSRLGEALALSGDVDGGFGLRGEFDLFGALEPVSGSRGVDVLVDVGSLDRNLVGANVERGDGHRDQVGDRERDRHGAGEDPAARPNEGRSSDTGGDQ